MAIPAALLGEKGEMGQLMGSPLINYFLSMRFNLGLRDTVHVFIVGYAFLLFHAYHHRSEFKPFEGILKYSLSIFLLLFATSFFHRSLCGPSPSWGCISWKIEDSGTFHYSGLHLFHLHFL